MFPSPKRRLANSDASEANSNPGRSELTQCPARGQLTNESPFPAKKQRIASGVKVLLDIVKESSDWFPPLKSVLSGVSTLIKHYEVTVE